MSEMLLPPRYVDQGRIAGGAMGEIHRVYDRELDRILALKVLRASLVDDPVVVRRFQAEARLTARLQHPGVVPIHDRGVFGDGRAWFAMKEIRGRTLSVVCARGLEVRRGVGLFLRVCETVAYAHSQGIVHRDIKPDNIMVGEFGEVLVLDWGLAGVVAETEPLLANTCWLPQGQDPVGSACVGVLAQTSGADR